MNVLVRAEIIFYALNPVGLESADRSRALNSVRKSLSNTSGSNIVTTELGFRLFISIPASYRPAGGNRDSQSSDSDIPP